MARGGNVASRAARQIQFYRCHNVSSYTAHWNPYLLHFFFVFVFLMSLSPFVWLGKQCKSVSSFNIRWARSRTGALAARARFRSLSVSTPCFHLRAAVCGARHSNHLYVTFQHPGLSRNTQKPEDHPSNMMATVMSNRHLVGTANCQNLLNVSGSFLVEEKYFDIKGIHCFCCVFVFCFFFHCYWFYWFYCLFTSYDYQIHINDFFFLFLN